MAVLRLARFVTGLAGIGEMLTRHAAPAARREGGQA
jgi:hypothetical protein